MNKAKVKSKKRLTKAKNRIDEPALPVSAIRFRPNEFAMPGVSILPLSPLTQKVIGCIIGDTITAEQPWAYIKKEKIEDNIDLHEDSSEFLSIKHEIRAYPEEEVLMGIDVSVMEKQEFFICLTKDAKKNVLLKIEQRKQELEDRLNNAVTRKVLPWRSLGSEIDVNDDLPKKFRKLFEISVESRFPMWTSKVKFSTRPAKALHNGYMELLPERHTGRNVIKLRVDKGAQASPVTATNESQTDLVYPKNQNTQYSYEYDEPKLGKSDFLKLNEFLDSRVDGICDNIRVNGNINLHEDDYEDLVKRKQAPPLLDHREILLLQDVLYCKGMKVSCMAWHPWISGIVAVAYNKTPNTHIYTEEPPLKTAEETIFTKNLVLIWSYSDNLLPKLYLYAEREVLTITFCDTNPNIVAGGMCNGQVILWDITDRLEQVETRKILTQEEKKHSLIMHEMMDWMKFTYSKSTVHATLTSDMDYGHICAITSLSWLSTKYDITSNGKITKALKPTMQFVTSGTDGYVYVWDLNRTQRIEETEKKISVKVNRLGAIPSALTLHYSPLAHLNKTLRPYYCFIANHPILKLKLPINNIQFDLPQYVYTPLNPDTVPNITERTYFKQDGELPFEFIPNFILGTSIGLLEMCTWEGHDFDQGQKINSEICKLTPFLAIHDGPITCSKSPFFPNLFLTLGGRVFAIWNSKYPEVPVLWRKTKTRYIFAVWSRFNPSLVIVARFDSHLELWDLCTINRLPNSVQKLSGNLFIDGSTEIYKVHVRKFTIGVCDQSGALKIYHLHHSFTRRRPEKYMLVQRMLQVIQKRKEVLKKWRADWIQQYVVKPEEKDVDEEEIVPEKTYDEPKPVFQPKLSPATRFAVRQEQFMYQTLLQKKKLNIVEIERQKIPLEKLRNESIKRLKKEQKIIAQKERIFETQKNIVIKDAELHRRPLISVELSTDQVTATKCKYVTAFKETEQHIMTFIKKHPYRHRFDWKEMISHSKRRTPKIYERKGNRPTMSQLYALVEMKDAVSDMECLL